jgi:hypothetical protein
MSSAYKVLVEKSKRKIPLLRQRLKRKVILNYILRKYMGLNSCGSRRRLVGGSCEHDYEIWVSVEGVEFFDQLSDY